MEPVVHERNTSTNTWWAHNGQTWVNTGRRIESGHSSVVGPYGNNKGGRSSIRKNRSQRVRRLRGGALSETVYVVLENGELYPNAYSTYELARQAVLTKYADELREERKEFEDWGKKHGLNMA